MEDIYARTVSLKRPCAHPGCASLVEGGYCEKHKPKEAERRLSRDWHKLYFTKRWRYMRAMQLMREPFCRDCAARGIRSKATDVDHVLPHRGDKRKFYDASNLQSLCHGCHSSKTMKEKHEA